MLAAGFRIPCLLLHAHQLGGFHGQGGEILAKRLGNHFLRPVQVKARVDQIAGGLHGLGAANAFENGGHRIRMLQGVFAGGHGFAGQQRLGEGTCPGQSVHLFGHGHGRRLYQGRHRLDPQARRGRIRRRRNRRSTFHGQTPPAITLSAAPAVPADSRNFSTSAT
ncbi:hypothetical protein D3C78_1267000 [compost metagenome]